eukprot:jgi/Undpi1/10422/HiC_scaffold_29.g12872.m1
MRAVLGSGSGSGGSSEVEFGGASRTPFTMDGKMKGKDVVVEGGKISGTGIALGCAPVEQVEQAGRGRWPIEAMLDMAWRRAGEATVTSLPEGGAISLGVSRRPAPDGDSEALLGKSKLGDGEKTWGFCTLDGGAAGSGGDGAGTLARAPNTAQRHPSNIESDCVHVHRCSRGLEKHKRQKRSTARIRTRNTSDENWERRHREPGANPSTWKRRGSLGPKPKEGLAVERGKAGTEREEGQHPGA